MSVIINVMIDTSLHNSSSNINNYDSFDSYLTKYHGNKPSFKSIIWENYDWLKEINDNGQARELILLITCDFDTTITF